MFMWRMHRNWLSTIVCVGANVHCAPYLLCFGDLCAPCSHAGFAATSIEEGTKKICVKACIELPSARCDAGAMLGSCMGMLPAVERRIKRISEKM